MNLIFMGIIPFVLLIVLNSLMLRSLVRQNRSRAANAANMMLCNAKEVALAKVSGAGRITIYNMNNLHLNHPADKASLSECRILSPFLRSR